VQGIFCFDEAGLPDLGEKQKDQSCRRQQDLLKVPKPDHRR